MGGLVRVEQNVCLEHVQVVAPVHARLGAVVHRGLLEPLDLAVQNIGQVLRKFGNINKNYLIAFEITIKKSILNIIFIDTFFNPFELFRVDFVVIFN